MLSLSPRNEIELQFRGLSMTAQAFHDLGKEINVVLTPQSGLTVADEETNYGSIPFSCPGARHVVPAGTIGNERLALVIGDEYSVLYSFHPSGRDQGPVSSSSPATSPRASAVNRSPQSELKSIGKRRKSSMAEPGEQWHINPVWRARQGFGTILS
jgi:DNA damage-binding protein 1